jgi:hypothetical protein
MVELLFVISIISFIVQCYAKKREKECKHDENREAMLRKLGGDD